MKEMAINEEARSVLTRLSITPTDDDTVKYKSLTLVKLPWELLDTVLELQNGNPGVRGSSRGFSSCPS